MPVPKEAAEVQCSVLEVGWICFFLRLDAYSWDRFVPSLREWLMKELLKLLSDVFCESLQDYINLD